MVILSVLVVKVEALKVVNDIGMEKLNEALSPLFSNLDIHIQYLECLFCTKRPCKMSISLIESMTACLCQTTGKLQVMAMGVVLWFRGLNLTL